MKKISTSNGRSRAPPGTDLRTSVRTLFAFLKNGCRATICCYGPSTPRSDIPVLSRFLPGTAFFLGFGSRFQSRFLPGGLFPGMAERGNKGGFAPGPGFFHLFLGFGRPGTKPSSRADFNPGSESRFRTPVRTRIGPIRVLVPPSPETRKSRKPGGGSVKTIYSRSRPAEREKAGGIEIPLKFTHPKAGPF